jgi:hypothetical protein
MSGSPFHFATVRVSSRSTEPYFNSPFTSAMKAMTLFRRAWCWLVALTLAVPALAVERVEPTRTLKVNVITPPSWNILIDDRVSEWFVDSLRDIFSRKGFDWPVEEIRLVEDAAKIPYLLTIHVTDWRLDRIGNVECTFTAQLQTPHGQRQLRYYSNRLPRAVDSYGRIALARVFEEAAEGALTTLCEDIAKSELLPGLNERVSPQA